MIHLYFNFVLGYTYNWSPIKYIITKVQKTDPVTYLIKEEGPNGEEIIGSFYNQELKLA